VGPATADACAASQRIEWQILGNPNHCITRSHHSRRIFSEYYIYLFSHINVDLRGFLANIPSREPDGDCAPYILKPWVMIQLSGELCHIVDETDCVFK
jgi:hypothetical protein